MSEKDEKEGVETPEPEQEVKKPAGEKEPESAEGANAAKAEAAERDLELAAQKIMEEEGVDTLYSAGSYWFASEEYAKEHAKAVGGEVKTYRRK